MRRGDPAARSVVDQYLAYLADGLANYVNIFQPEVICLGGGGAHSPSSAAPMIPASFPNSAMAIRHRSANSG